MSRDGAGAIAEAARWRLLGLLLERPRAGWHAEVARLAAEVADPGLVTLAGAAREASEGAYLRLLGPGGAVSPREVAYRGLEDPGWVLADVARFYEAFAYRPRAEDPPDHVAVEAGFVGYLLLKEELARSAGDGEAARTTGAARAAFLGRHLAALAAPLARALDAAGGGVLAAAAAALAASTPPAAAPASGPAPPADCAGCGGAR